MRTVVLAVLAAVLVGQAAAISIKWTGYAGNNQWETGNNWYPNQVPGPNDDVTIDKGVVYLTAPTGVNSLGMGTSFDTPANLTIFSNFYVVQTMTVDGNGNLFINSGAVTITGTINIAGNLFFGAGTLSGQWTIGSRGSASLSSPGLKGFSGCQFNAGGALTISGIIALNQSSVFTITSSATASGAFAIQAQDTTTVLFDASAGTLTYQGGGDFQIQAPVKLGTFNFVAGNLTLFDSVNFVNSFAIPNGSYVATVGAANVNMTAGVTGAGVLTAEGATIVLGNVNLTGDLNIGGGAASFTSEQNYVALLTIFGGTTTLTNGVSTGMVNLLSGVLNGPAGIVSVKGYINTAGFNLNAPVHLGGSVSVLGKSILAFGASGRLTFGTKAVVTVSGSLQFTGAPGSPGVFNNGVLNVAGPVSFQNVNLGGSGTCNVGSTLQVSSITFAQNGIALSSNGVFKGANTLISNIATVSAASTVFARFGQYQLTCPTECDNVNTNGIPTDTFRFSASSSMAKKH